MYKPVNLLVIDDDETLSKVFEKVCKEEGWTFSFVPTAQQALEILSQQVVEVAMVDVNLPGFNGMQVLKHVKDNQLPTEVIMMTGIGTIESVVDAIKKGAYDYIAKPFADITKVVMVIMKAREHYTLLQKLRRYERVDSTQNQFEGLVGKSRKIQDVFNVIENVAATTSTILILGESGTGKELVARAIHKRSKRAGNAFVAINCAAISENLLESELFGHKKGSFTGAIQDKKGLFEEADQGTIFLDEISEIPTSLQVKLLRALQEGEIRAVGGNQSHQVDARVIAATNRNLAKMVEEGGFREDLYYRLNVISIELPALRERVEDIPVLAYHFLKKYAKKLDKKVESISLDALQVIQAYSWSGNVRELENMIERAVVLCTTDTITAHDLPARILGESFYLADDSQINDLTQYTYQEAKNKALWSFNRNYIANLLRQTNGNLTTAAEKSGMDRSNFKKILKKYNIDVDEFRKRGLIAT